MAIELRPVTAEHVPELGRILHDAFRDIAERHGFPADFATVEFATMVVGLLLQQEDVYAVAACDGDAPRGSNFIRLTHDVAGIGPVSVDVAAQGQGIGRTTMQDVIAHARAQGYERIRLCQDAFNMQSLALYASLGFDTKEPLAYMQLAAGAAPDPAFRAATPADLDAMDGLCRAIYRISRQSEAETLMRLQFPAFVLDRGGRIAGYLLGTPMGHGVAETEDDMLALLAGMGASAPDAHALVPLRNGTLYRRALEAGHRNVKVMNLMAIGAYEEPAGTYVSSVLF